jgi:HAD superfamily hydrolase (TIGR01459 family)
MRITLPALSERYDVFLIDQYGVLRDDIGAYPYAISALQFLRKKGKTVVILTNSGRTGAFNTQRFQDIGFARDLFDCFATSGDAAASTLRERPLVKAGSQCLTISSGDDTNLADRLNYSVVDDPLRADILVISGSQSERISLDDYRKILEPMALRQVPCVCTNPDMYKFAQGKPAPGAGAIARAYESFGGRVQWFGKPMPAIYDLACKLAGSPSKERVVCIGDSIEHDIQGASNFGLASVLVGTGILSQQPPKVLEDLMCQFNCVPTYNMPAFC